MSYRLHRFENALLPIYDPEPDFSQGPVDATLLDSVGGVFDYYGTRQRLPRRQQISFSGLYLGEQSVFVDHLGNFFVDHDGNRYINGTAEAELRGQINALTAYLGQRGKLYRQHLADPDRLEWKLARLMAVGHPRTQKDTPLTARISCTFETAQAAWRADPAIETSLTSGSGARALTVTVGGNATVYDAVITVTAAATVSSIHFQHGDQSVDWTWTGTLNNGETLTVDCGAQTWRIGSTNAYSGLAYASGHAARGILPLAPGENALVVTTNANAAVTITHNDQWL